MTPRWPSPDLAELSSVSRYAAITSTEWQGSTRREMSLQIALGSIIQYRLPGKSDFDPVTKEVTLAERQ
jgi:hypothetical protein